MRVCVPVRQLFGVGAAQESIARQVRMHPGRRHHRNDRGFHRAGRDVDDQVGANLAAVERLDVGADDIEVPVPDELSFGLDDVPRLLGELSKAGETGAAGPLELDFSE